MPYIIDGHNLIGRLPDIQIDDENDENKLIVKLKGFVAGCGKKAIVVFDKGLPGGIDREKSTTQLEVVYASALGSDADSVIMGRIRKAKDAKNWTVVSSDNEVRDVAIAHGMKVMRSSEFVAMVQERRRKQRHDPSEAIHPRIDPKDNDELLNAFLQKDKSSDLNKKPK